MSSARLGGSRALVLSTAGRAQQAELAIALLGARAAGRFAGAEMHTPVEVTERALSTARSVAADSLVSIGGGSTTGLGKALAARTGLPHLVIPTTYAGSEVTPVLGETEGGEKATRSAPEIVPDAVIYDVELTLGLPWDVTVTSAVNAMAHAVEATYAASRTEPTDWAALEALGSLASDSGHSPRTAGASTPEAICCTAPGSRGPASPASRWACTTSSATPSAAASASPMRRRTRSSFRT